MDKKKRIKGKKDFDKSRKKELYWIIGAILILAAVFFISYFAFNNFNNFQYNGLSFTRERFGDIPVFHHYYFFNYGGETYKYNLFLRKDPRKNAVPMTGRAVENGVEFTLGNNVYVSVDPNGLVGCEYGAVGISQLSSFLADNQLKVEGASPIKEIADELNVSYATCNTNPLDTVVIIKGGDETSVDYVRNNCAIISIAQCQVLEAIEKFQVKAVLDARARANARNNKTNV